MGFLHFHIFEKTLIEPFLPKYINSWNEFIIDVRFDVAVRMGPQMSSEQTLLFCLKCSRRFRAHVLVQSHNVLFHPGGDTTISHDFSSLCSTSDKHQKIRVNNIYKIHFLPPLPRDSLISWAASSPMRSSWSTAGSFSSCQVKKWKRQGGWGSGGSSFCWCYL